MTQQQAFEKHLAYYHKDHFFIKYDLWKIWQAACEWQKEQCLTECEKVVNEVYSKDMFPPPEEEKLLQMDSTILTQLSAEVGRRTAKFIAKAIRNE